MWTAKTELSENADVKTVLLRGAIEAHVQDSKRPEKSLGSRIHLSKSVFHSLVWTDRFISFRDTIYKRRFFENTFMWTGTKRTRSGYGNRRF